MGFRSGRGGIGGTGLQFAPPGSVIELGNTADAGISNALLRADARWSFPAADLETALLQAALFDRAGRLDVRDYGAKGDGATDDAAAINAAIAACPAGGVVFFPPSVYGVLSPVFGKANVTLLGTHAARWPYDGGDPCVIKALAGFAGNSIINIAEVDAVTPTDGGRVMHLAVDGSAATGTVRGIQLEGACRDWGFFFVAIDKAPSSNFRCQTNSGRQPKGLTLIRVTTWQSGSNGFSINDATDCVLLDCLAVSNFAVGYFFSNSGDNQVYACRAVFNGADGFQYTGAHTGSLFAGCSTDRNDKYGFTVSATGDYPLTLLGLNLRRDGNNGGAGGGGYAGLHIAGGAGALVCPIYAVGIDTSTGVNDDGSGAEAPAYGLASDYAKYLFVDGILWGVTGAYLDGGHNTEVRFGPGAIAQTGPHTGATRSTVPLDPSTLVDLMDANPEIARSSEGGSVQQGVLTPVFYPVLPHGLKTFSLQALAARVRTLESGKTVGLAVYAVAYSAAGTFTATLVASLAAALSGTTAGTKVGDVTGAPVTLDFVHNRYFIGAMVDSTTTLALSTNTAVQGGSNGALKWTAAARSSTTDWPATFTQASVAAVASGDKLPWAGLFTAYGKELL